MVRCKVYNLNFCSLKILAAINYVPDANEDTDVHQNQYVPLPLAGHHIFLFAQYLVNQWLDSYQIFILTET